MKVFLISLIFFFSALPLNNYAKSESHQTQGEVRIDKRKLLVPPRGANQVTFVESPTGWILAEQQKFYTGISAAMRSFSSGHPITAAWSLMLVSFGYGILHAAGPGHGKVVISGWLLASEQQLRRGIFISAMSSFIQTMVAILLVGGILLIIALAGGTARDAAQEAGSWLQRASYAMITGLGLWLLWQSIGPTLSRRNQREYHEAHQHPHHQKHTHTNNHRHLHNSGSTCDCGHSHMPVANDLTNDWSLGRAMSLAVAVGIRPCTGALLVLLFANAAGLYLAGVAATFAMALGTFITVSVIAALAVMSKKLALRLAATNDKRLAWLTFGLRFGAGIVISILGITLFVGSLSGTQGSV